MGSATSNPLLVVLVVGCIFTGCQIGQDLYSSSLTDTGTMSEDKSAVVDELGPVAVLKRGRPLLPKFRHAATQRVQEAGYELRGSVEERTFRHLSGTMASVFYFTELKDDGINAEFRADLRHGFGHIRAVKNLEPHSSAAPSRGRQVRRGLRHLKRPNSTNARARMDFGMRQHRG